MAYASIAELRDYLDQVPEYGQQRVTVTGSPTGGTFTLSYDGTATATIAYNATATAVQTALRAISAIGATGVNVIGKPGGPWLAKFNGPLATDAALLILGTNSLTGGSSPSVTIATAKDRVLQRVLDDATAMIDLILGTSFATGGPGAKTVYGDGTDYLVLPPFVTGSVTSVTAPTGYTVPDYTEIDGALVVTRSGLVGPLYHYESVAGRLYTPYGAWLAGVPYAVTATYGYAAVPDDIKEACLQIAVDLFRFKDAGSIKSVGVEGAGIVTGKGLPTTAALILEARLQRASVPGVY